MFDGFPEETIRFFLGLRFHNDAAYFNAHKDEFEAYVKKPFFQFISALAPTMETIADDFELRPEKCLARIRRDTRFTKDKTPYRDHLWLLFKRAGEPRDDTVMYWFELSPDTMNWGLGFWGPNRPALNALRTMIVAKPSKVLDAFQEARVPDERFAIDGETYSRIAIPDGVAEPLLTLYPRKALYVFRKDISVSDAYTARVVALCAQDFVRLKPLYRLFRELADIGMATMDA
jgi:uncharacterized protein (TIGR02453 family)